MPPLRSEAAFTAIDGPQLVFVNGHYLETLSQVGELPAGVEVRPLLAGKSGAACS